MATSLLIGWALCNPYFEIDHSSLIYFGRMLAELDPSGVGRDAMYRLDGQSGFTVFTAIDRALVLWLGLATTSIVVSIASVIAAFVGAAALACSVSRGRTRILAIIYAATLPACYGGYKLFSYAETAATPRPFAEALVLCGIAALVNARTGWSAAAMLGAAVLHPILALPGALLLIAWLVLEDRRWSVLLVVGGLVGLGACAVHLPLFDRMTVLMDADWKAILEGRDPHLFPSLWPEGWMGRFAARIATLIVAASLTAGAVRRTFLLTLVVGLCGFGVAYLLDERMPIVLLVQAQTWRTTWLMFALAPMAAAVCTIRLWPLGGMQRVTLALLALSWIYADHDQIAILLACVAIAFRFCADPDQYRMSDRSTRAVLAVAAGLALFGLVLGEVEIGGITATAPAGSAEETRRILALDWDYTPLAALAAVLVWMKREIATSTLAATMVLGTSLLAIGWDRRSSETRDFDEGAGMPALSRFIASTEGEVLWLGGVQESWRWLGRPNWISPIQGAGIVFSRPLAMFYQDRTRRAAMAGLDEGMLLAPYGAAGSTRKPMEEARLTAFCAAPDAPAWIVAPLGGKMRLPSAFKPTEWALPSARLAFELSDDGTMIWRRVSRVEVAACAGHGGGV